MRALTYTVDVSLENWMNSDTIRQEITDSMLNHAESQWLMSLGHLPRVRALPQVYTNMVRMVCRFRIPDDVCTALLLQWPEANTQIDLGD